MSHRIPGGARTLRVEVPAHLLPSIDFNRDKSRKSIESKPKNSTPVLAAFSAITIFNGVMPILLNHGASQDEVNGAVLEGASAHWRIPGSSWSIDRRRSCGSATGRR